MVPALSTPAPTPTAKPKKPKPKVKVLRTEKVKVSHYDPALGGTNCSNFQNGVCISHMASGKAWQDWIDKGAACPAEWPFGTRFRLPDGRVFECQDRGGAIRYGADGLPFVDLLTQKNPGYGYGEVITVEILK